MLTGAVNPEDVDAFVRQLLASAPRAAGAPSFDFAMTRPDPVLLRRPGRVRGFRVRLDLRDVKPPVWRRLVLPGDIGLLRLHEVIQAAMGWTNSHLHQFRTGADRRSPSFVTEFDLSEGDDGILEDDVRLDQIVASPGDALWYAYDFGDGWDHVLKVEQVLPDPPTQVKLLAGRRACPPEDVGGPWGYRGVAAWVESGYDPDLLPDQFDDQAHARDWLPLDWHPATFDLNETQESIRQAEAGEWGLADWV